MDEAGEKLKRAFTGAFALLFAVIVLCAVFCNQNVFGTQSPRSLLAGGLALAVGVLCAAWLLRLLPAPGKRLRRTLLAAFFTLWFRAGPCGQGAGGGCHRRLGFRHRAARRAGLCGRRCAGRYLFQQFPQQPAAHAAVGGVVPSAAGLWCDGGV